MLALIHNVQHFQCIWYNLNKVVGQYTKMFLNPNLGVHSLSCLPWGHMTKVLLWFKCFNLWSLCSQNPCALRRNSKKWPIGSADLWPWCARIKAARMRTPPGRRTVNWSGLRTSITRESAKDAANWTCSTMTEKLLQENTRVRSPTWTDLTAASASSR